VAVHFLSRTKWDDRAGYREGNSSGINLPDPDPSLDVENVRTLFCATFPEITTAALTGPEVVDGKLVWTFTKAVGTKG
jgi:PRTRC genetic system protein C